MTSGGMSEIEESGPGFETRDRDGLYIKMINDSSVVSISSGMMIWASGNEKGTRRCT